MSADLELEKLADVLWQFKVETLQRAPQVLSRIVDTKLAIRAAAEGEESQEDRASSDELRKLRRHLDSPDLEMTGPETVLLGSFYKHVEGTDLLDTRALNVTLGSYGRKPSNTSSTIESLEKKGYLEFVAGEGLHAHKTYRLTEKGEREAKNLLGRLSRKGFSAVG